MAQESLKLVLPGIQHEGRLPRKYTQAGQGAQKDISPPLQWYGVPDGTHSLALVVQDIDAPDPSGPIVPWTHWVVVNIPPTVKGLPEGFSGKEEGGGDYKGIKEGNNDWKIPGWRAQTAVKRSQVPVQALCSGSTTTSRQQGDQGEDGGSCPRSRIR